MMLSVIAFKCHREKKTGERDELNFNTATHITRPDRAIFMEIAT